jgi:hypothetical protein
VQTNELWVFLNGMRFLELRYCTHGTGSLGVTVKGTEVTELHHFVISFVAYFTWLSVRYSIELLDGK